MTSAKSTCLVSMLALVTVFGAGTIAFAAPNVSEADKSFVAKVSQGGMYEVELGKVAEKQGTTQDIKDQGSTEAHDHMLVGERLKAAAKGADITFATDLNDEFQARLKKISGLSGATFDKAYIADMKKIHAADGAAFKQEAKSGTNPGLRAFAAETYDIVQRHIGELKARTTTID